MMSNSTIDVRCYCHGLGDCMLVTMEKLDGSPFRILIDCGIHTATENGTVKLRTVVEDIIKVTGGMIDVIVGTHEHWDHLSAFYQFPDLMKELTIGEVWFSWAENPSDPDARALDKYKADAAAALAGSALKLSSSEGMDSVAGGVDALLSFVFGAQGEKVRAARENLRRLGKTPPVVRHFEPGTLAPLPNVPGIKVYVLGPPRDKKLLGIEDIPSETYAVGSGPLSVAPIANAINIQDKALFLNDDLAAPFDGTVGTSFTKLLTGNWDEDPANAGFFWTHYLAQQDASTPDVRQDWRRIDNDWLVSSVDLALQLDGRTNNTSLVLAFEIEESKKVLLFAADAQVGNWMSWPAVVFPSDPNKSAVTGDDLISRTVFYKVGHHGSRNATRSVQLEKMDRSQLVAFSPTDKGTAGKVRWKDFPAPKTNARINELTSGRFIQADDEWLKDPNATCPIQPGGALISITHEPNLFVDLKLG